jgi:hypothetical protein
MRTKALVVQYSLFLSQLSFITCNGMTMTTTKTLVHNITNTGYQEPLWWSRLWAIQDTTSNLAEPLHRCQKRTSPPPVGSSCRFDKTCYFGTQDCNGYGAHPQTRWMGLGFVIGKIVQCIHHPRQDVHQYESNPKWRIVLL